VDLVEVDQSVPRRRRLFSHSWMIQRRELPAGWVAAHATVHLGREHDVVAAVLHALPTISSTRLRVHVGGVDEVDPESSALWMILIESS